MTSKFHPDQLKSKEQVAREWAQQAADMLGVNRYALERQRRLWPADKGAIESWESSVKASEENIEYAIEKGTITQAEAERIAAAGYEESKRHYEAEEAAGRMAW